MLKFYQQKEKNKMGNKEEKFVQRRGQRMDVVINQLLEMGFSGSQLLGIAETIISKREEIDKYAQEFNNEIQSQKYPVI